jgi:hypothetical protein
MDDGRASCRCKKISKVEISSGFAPSFSSACEAEHAKEMRGDIPTEPVLFKNPIL